MILTSSRFSTPALAPGTHRFRLKQLDFDGGFEYSPVVEVTLELTGSHHLSPAYPNPFRSRTRFALQVADDQPVRVRVYDALGRLVDVLFDGPVAEGQKQEVVFDAGSLPAGVYVLRAEGVRFTASRTVLKTP